ncbi:MAG TPA: SIS domain-containing protein [Streptosporangiaceae bacterium]
MDLELDESRLDDTEALAAHDPGEMLRAVASGAAQVRVAARAAAEAGVARLADEGRPRAVVAAGMGGSGVAGDVLAAVCGSGCPVPVLTVRDYTLPGWVGAADLVMAVSCSGATEETLSVAREAARRGCRLLAVGAAGSPLADVATQAGGVFVPVESAGQPRSTLWGLAIPLVAAAAELRLFDPGPDPYETLAALLEDLAARCGPATESLVNPGKVLARELVGTVPMVWGSSPLAAVAAYRLSCQLAENAKYPSIAGALPEADHNQVVALDGWFGADIEPVDIFRDRVEDPLGPPRLRLVLLRDTEEHPQTARRREATARLAAERGVPISELPAEGATPLARLASLITVTDYASVYLALAYGIDPTPVEIIDRLKAEIADPSSE